MIWDEHAYLLIDEAIIASHEGTSIVRDEAWKHQANPIAGPQSRELFNGGEPYRLWPKCICRDGGRYRMWYAYQCSEDSPRHWAYAESDDGIDFKPVRTAKQANAWQVTPADRQDLRWNGMMHDPADADAPYKAVVMRRGDISQLNQALVAKYPDDNRQWHGHGSEGWFAWGLATSRDGLDWRLPTHQANLVDAIIEEPCVYRALDGGYVIGNQMVSRVADIQWRKIKGWLTYDMVTSQRIPDWVFALPDHMTFVEPRYLGRQAWANTPWVQSHVELVPARKGPSMIALHGYLYGAVGTETYAQVADVGLAISSTGYHFHQVWPFRPFIRRGERGAWDCGLVRQVALVDTDDQTWCYYIASDVGNAANCHYWLGIAHIDRDRYGYHVLRVYRDYARPKARRGEIVMKPITLPDMPALAMNVSHVTAQRTVRVELRDPGTGLAIRGFEFDACQPLTHDSLRAPLRWRDANVQALASQDVVLAIELTSPDCRFADQDSPRAWAIYTK